MKCLFCFIFVFCFFWFNFFWFFVIFLSEALSQDLLKILRREHNIEDTKALFSPKTRVKLLGEIFVWKIFFPCSVETTKEGYCLRYRLCRLENSMAFSFFRASGNTQRPSFRSSGNFFCVKYLVFSLKYRLLSPPYFCYCKNWQKGTTMIGLEY